MFGIGFFELCVIAVVALVFVGPKKLPDLMRQVGRFFVQVRRMTTDVKGTVEDVIRDAEQEIQREELQKIRDLLPKGSDITGDPDRKSASKSGSENRQVDSGSGSHKDPHHQDQDNTSQRDQKPEHTSGEVSPEESVSHHSSPSASKENPPSFETSDDQSGNKAKS